MVLLHVSDYVTHRCLGKCGAAKELVHRDIISHVGTGLRLVVVLELVGTGDGDVLGELVEQ